MKEGRVQPSSAWLPALLLASNTEKQKNPGRESYPLITRANVSQNSELARRHQQCKTATINQSQRVQKHQSVLKRTQTAQNRSAEIPSTFLEPSKESASSPILQTRQPTRFTAFPSSSQQEIEEVTTIVKHCYPRLTET